jgi:hypothetical protein
LVEVKKNEAFVNWGRRVKSCGVMEGGDWARVICSLFEQHLAWWRTKEEVKTSRDVDPMERLEEVGGVICKSTFANHPSHLPCIL